MFKHIPIDLTDVRKKEFVLIILQEFCSQMPEFLMFQISYARVSDSMANEGR